MIKRIFIILVSVIFGISFLLADSEPESKMVLRDLILEVSSNYVKGLYNPDSYDEKWLPRIVQATNKEVANRVVKEKEAVVEEKPVVLKQMYCITNNVPVYKDFPSTDASADAPAGVPAGTPAVLAVPGDTNVKGYIDQLMKYDRVGLIETKGEWARIVRSPSVLNEVKDVSRGATQGWVSKNTLAEWKIEEFLKQKENVFKENKRIELYAESGDIQEVSVKTKKIDYIEPGETFRVLKGNGEGFFVVTGSGKTGWIANKSIDTTRLVAKGFGYKEKSEYTFPKSQRYLDDTPAYKGPVEYKMMPEDMLDEGMINGNYEKVLHIGEKRQGRKSEIVLMQNGIETNLTEAIEKCSPLIRNRVIDGKEYEFERIVELNFFGMVGVIDVGIPKEYKELRSKFLKKNRFGIELMGRGGWFIWEDYEKFVEFVRKSGKYEEVVKIALYSRNVNITKIKEFDLKGTFAIKASLEHLKEDINQIKEENGLLVIKFGVAENGVLLDDLPKMLEGGNSYFLYPDYTGKEFFSGRKYVLKPKVVELKVEKEELTGCRLEMRNVLEHWNNYKNYLKNNLIDKALYKKFLQLLQSIVINEKTFKIEKDYIISDVDSKYEKVFNSFILYFFRLNDNGGGYIIVNNQGKILGLIYDKDIVGSGLGYSGMKKENAFLQFKYYKKENVFYNCNVLKGVLYEY